jgi:hypothetical protein
MLSRLAVTACTIIALASTPALGAGKPRNVSWGKAGVSYAQYRADAVECGNRAYGVEVELRPLGPLGTGWQGIILPASVWTSLTPGRIPVYTTTYVEAYRHAARIDTINQLQAVVDSCLAERGYQRFRLTSAQMRALRRYDRGTEARQLYLHDLGSDAWILSTQAIADRRRFDPTGGGGQS